MTTTTETIVSGTAKNATDIGKELLATAKAMREQAAEYECIAAILGTKKMGRPHGNSTSV
jgi:hypothetical protein